MSENQTKSICERYLKMFAEIGAVILIGLIVLKLYIKLQTKHCNDKRQLQGKTVLITGANAGEVCSMTVQFYLAKMHRHC